MPQTFSISFTQNQNLPKTLTLLFWLLHRHMIFPSGDANVVKLCGCYDVMFKLVCSMFQFTHFPSNTKANLQTKNSDSPNIG